MRKAKRYCGMVVVLLVVALAIELVLVVASVGLAGMAPLRRRLGYLNPDKERDGRWSMSRAVWYDTFRGDYGVIGSPGSSYLKMSDLAAAVTHEAMPGWATKIVDEQRTNSGNIEKVVVVTWGFPFRCATSTYSDIGGRGFLRRADRASEWLTSGYLPAAFNLLPAHILFRGSMLNVGCIGLLCAAIWKGRAMLRTFVWRRQGGCLQCGYPIGTGAVCSECGAAVGLPISPRA